MFVRKLSRFFLYGRFSNVKIFDGNHSDVTGMENISKLPFYLSFREGLNLSLENRLEQANQHYQQALNLLQDRKEELSEHYLHIYKKLIMNNYNLKKAKALEQNIYNIIKLKKQAKMQSLLVYEDYNSLFQVFLKFNPQKAIVLGKALLSEKQVQNMSLRHKKMFEFHLGNAYFLLGNYEDAKLKYSQCLQGQPSNELKIKTYNNLALACWWNKNPLISESLVEPSKNKIDLINSDYLQSRSIFLKALESSENPQALLDEQSKFRLKQALNQYQFDINAQFVKRESILPMFNLAQYYINNEPNEKVKILYWLQTLLKLSQLHKDKPIFDEVYITLNLLNNEREDLDSYVPTLLRKYHNQIHEIYFSRIQTFLYLSVGRQEEAQNLKLHISKLQRKYQAEDPFIFKRKYLSEYQFSI